MSEIIKAKNGKLHIYVRQDTYKGKLKSENWVGRTFFQGKQKVISSGTKDLEEAKIILEKWYDDLQNGSISPPEVKVSNNEGVTPATATSEVNNPEYTPRVEAQKIQPESTIKEQEPKKGILDKLKNTKIDLSFLKKIGSKDNKNSSSKFIQDISKTFSSKISKASVSNEEIAGVDITNDSIKVAQLSKESDRWILDKISTRLLDTEQVNNNILEAKDYISEEIKLAIANAKITTSNVALSVPVTSAIIRVVTSPLMTENELQSAIETDSLWENLVQLTDNLNDYSVFHQVISRNSKNNTMEILFVASKLSDVNAYSSIVKKAGLNPVIIDVKCFTLKNAFDNTISQDNKIQTAILEVGIDDNYLIIVHNNMPIITDIFLRPNEKEALLNIKSDNRNQDAETIIRRFSMQLKQALNEYETKYNNKINNIRIVSSLRNIEDIIIAFKKNLPTTGFKIFDPLHEVSIPKYNQDRVNIDNKSIFTSVIGLGYRKLDVFGYYKFVTAVKNINLLPNREALKRQNKIKFLSGFAFKGFAAGIAALYLLLISMSFFEYNSNKNKLESYAQIKTDFDKINAQHSKLKKNQMI